MCSQARSNTAGLLNGQGCIGAGIHARGRGLPPPDGFEDSELRRLGRSQGHTDPNQSRDVLGQQQYALPPASSLKSSKCMVYGRGGECALLGHNPQQAEHPDRRARGWGTRPASALTTAERTMGGGGEPLPGQGASCGMDGTCTGGASSGASSTMKFSRRPAATIRGAEGKSYWKSSVDRVLPGGAHLTCERRDSPTVSKRPLGPDLQMCVNNHATYRQRTARSKMSAVF